jgi:hypothetical protein
MKAPFLVITSIAEDSNEVLNKYSKECRVRDIQFILIGDTKSPRTFQLDGCDYYSIEDQHKLSEFSLPSETPLKHYSRKNIGYLIAISKGAEIIIETDDDNLPYDSFWLERVSKIRATKLCNSGWVNIYKYFVELNIWPRGFPLENILDNIPAIGNNFEDVFCPIQQGLADDNPDVDAIYRMILPLQIKFNDKPPIALSSNSTCPFNSQNTTWFKEAFPLLYLPSFCSFRMTDIWRSFIAQRISWTCGWSILFNNSTVYQIRNDHSIIKDFEDEIPGYLNNTKIMNSLVKLELKDGIENIQTNMILCYKELIKLGVIEEKELELLNFWLKDLNKFF